MRLLDELTVVALAIVRIARFCGSVEIVSAAAAPAVVLLFSPGLLDERSVEAGACIRLSRLIWSMEEVTIRTTVTVAMIVLGTLRRLFKFPKRTDASPLDTFAID